MEAQRRIPGRWWAAAAAQVVDYEREVELKFNRALGGRPPTEQEVFEIEMARENAATRRMARLKAEDQHRYQTELPEDGRATHLAGADPIPGARRPRAGAHPGGSERAPLAPCIRAISGIFPPLPLKYGGGSHHLPDGSSRLFGHTAAVWAARERA